MSFQHLTSAFIATSPSQVILSPYIWHTTQRHFPAGWTHMGLANTALNVGKRHLCSMHMENSLYHLQTSCANAFICICLSDQNPTFQSHILKSSLLVFRYIFRIFRSFLYLGHWIKGQSKVTGAEKRLSVSCFDSNLCKLWPEMFIFGVKVHLVNIYVKQLIQQGLTSHQTHYRSYRGRFLQVI